MLYVVRTMERGPQSTLHGKRTSGGVPLDPQTPQPKFGARFEPLRDAQHDPRIALVVEAIERNPVARIRDLSQLVNLSDSRLSHLFKAEKGISLHAFLANRRVERAAHLLRSTRMQIKEITWEAGFKQVPSFVRAFQRRFGSSPTRYRRQRLRLTNSRFD